MIGERSAEDVKINVADVFPENDEAKTVSWK